jgi:hypothetical protein
MTSSDRLIIDGFVVDLAVSIEEVGESEPTSFPVERGAPINDHVIKKPRTRSIEFRVSDTPIGDMVNLRAAGSVPSSEARAFLEELQDSARPFVVEYRDRRWEDQIFTNLTFAEDAERSGGLFATGQLQTMNLVDVRRVVVEGLVVASVASAKVKPKRGTWICPSGTLVDASDEVNRRNGCRLATQTSGGTLVYDDGTEVPDADRRRVLAEASAMITGAAIPGALGLPGAAGTAVINAHPDLGKHVGPPAGYTPPTDYRPARDALDPFDERPANHFGGLDGVL